MTGDSRLRVPPTAHRRRHAATVRLQRIRGHPAPGPPPGGAPRRCGARGLLSLVVPARTERTQMSVTGPAGPAVLGRCRPAPVAAAWRHPVVAATALALLLHGIWALFLANDAA